MAFRGHALPEMCMHLCETCQPQLLNYVYELLEEDERRGLEAHLETCADCRESLVRARRQQHALRAATRTSFADVHFAPPALRIPSSAAPAPARHGPIAGLRWRRWAVAACIALILCGSAAFGVYG